MFFAMVHSGIELRTWQKGCTDSDIRPYDCRGAIAAPQCWHDNFTGVYGVYCTRCCVGDQCNTGHPPRVRQSRATTPTTSTTTGTSTTPTRPTRTSTVTTPTRPTRTSSRANTSSTPTTASTCLLQVHVVLGVGLAVPWLL